MSPRSKKEYIEAIFLRYEKAPYKEKTIILDEFCVCYLWISPKACHPITSKV